MPARLESLRDDGVCSRRLCLTCFRERGDRCEPRDALSLNRRTRAVGYRPRMEDTTRGARSRKASHCSAKSGVTTCPADSGTSGPQAERNCRICFSCSSFRGCGGSGIQVLSCNAPLLAARN